jgi:DNA-binding beta-propeller fold protein YncE
MRNCRCLVVVLLSLGSAMGATAQSGPAGYHLAHSFIIGGQGGWDDLTADAAAHRLYVSHATRVEVVDTEKDAVIGEIPNTPGVHGIALAPDLGRGFTSNGRAGTVTVFDLKTLGIIGTVKVTGENPDAIAYDPVTHRVFTFNGRSANATAIDGATAKVVGTIPLGGKPEFAVADGKGRMYVNLEDTSAIVAFDARTFTIEGRWPLAPCQEPTGLAIDRAHRRLFAGCHNKLMAVMDADSGHVIATLGIGGGVDGVAFDPETALAFSSNGDGTLTVAHEDSANAFRLVGTVMTKRGARTLALDQATHRIYLSTAEFGPPPEPGTGHRRPPIVPGTFEVLVVER